MQWRRWACGAQGGLTSLALTRCLRFTGRLALMPPVSCRLQKLDLSHSPFVQACLQSSNPS